MNKKNLLSNPLLSRLLVIFPPAILAYVIVTSYAQIPILDEWSFLTQLDRYYSGTLSIAHLWESIAGSRILFPQIWLVLWGVVSRFNIGFILILNFVLSAALFLAFLRVTCKLNLKQSQPISNGLLILISVLFFSLTSLRNWLWAWLAVYWIWLFAATTALILLSNKKLNNKVFFFVICCAVVSSLSFIGGVTVWLAGLVLIYFSDDFLQKKNRLVAWGGAFLMTLAGGYLRPSVFELIEKEGIVYHAAFFLKLIGAPFIRFLKPEIVLNEGLPHFLTLTIGSIGVLLFIFVGITFVRKKGVFFERALFFISYGIMMLSTLLMVALSRAHVSNIQPFASRYMIYSNLFWICLLVLLAVYVYENQNKIIKKAFTGLCLLVFTGQLTALPYLLKNAKEYKRIFGLSKEVLITQTDPRLIALHHDQQVLRQQIALLKKHQLSVFNES